MICPKCSADTRVIDSRPHREDARVIVRRRRCDGYGHRFNTQEGTFDIVRRRTVVREEAAKRRARLCDQERAAIKARTTDLRAARDEAARTGGDQDAILRSYGAPARSWRTSNLNP